MDEDDKKVIARLGQLTKSLDAIGKAFGKDAGDYELHNNSSAANGCALVSCFAYALSTIVKDQLAFKDG
jgi:hypothetical protein